MESQRDTTTRPAIGCPSPLFPLHTRGARGERNQTMTTQQQQRAVIRRLRASSETSSNRRHPPPTRTLRPRSFLSRGPFPVESRPQSWQSSPASSPDTMWSIAALPVLALSCLTVVSASALFPQRLLSIGQNPTDSSVDRLVSWLNQTGGGGRLVEQKTARADPVVSRLGRTSLRSRDGEEVRDWALDLVEGLI